MTKCSRILLLTSVAMAAGLTSVQAEDRALALDEVVVMVQKRKETLQNVPLAVSALDAEAIREGGYGDLEDLTSRVPNLNISALWGTSNPKIFMRGIGNNNFNQTAESKVAVYLDQVYLSAPSGQMFQMYDLERLEVLRGPQGTLYGKNATGGAITVTSRLPGHEFEGYGRVSYGNFDAFEAESAVTLPLAETLSARVAFVTKDRDGYLTDLGSGKKVNDIDQWAARTILRWQPGDATDIRLNIHGGKASSTHNNSAHRGLFDPVALGGFEFVRMSPADIIARNGVDILGYRDPDADPYVNTYGTDTFANIDLFGVSLIADIGIGHDYTLTSVSGYEKSKRHVLQEGNGAPSTIFTIDWGPSEFEQYQQELRIASPDTDAFKWVAGAFLFKEDGAVNNFYNLASVNFALGFDAFDQYYTQNTRTFAVFGQGSYEWDRGLTLTIGGRYNYEKRELDHQTYITDVNRVSAIPGPLVDVDLKDSWTEWSGRVALDYKPWDDVMFFASVNRGFTSGGFNTGAFNDPIGAAEIYDPETLISYEIGAKTTLLDRRLRLNVTGFYYDYSDLQVFTFTSSGQQFIENASDARVYGIEFEVQALVTRNWELSGSVGVLDSKYKNFVRGTEDLSGNRLIGAPNIQFNVLSQYTVPVSFGAFTLRTDFTYTGKRYYDERQFEEISSEGADINLDARLTYENNAGNIQISLWAKNLTNEVTIIDVVDVGLFGYQNVWYNTPRTYGIEFGVTF